MITGTWTSDATDLELIIVKVHHQSPERTKVAGILRNKKNGLVYEHKNYSLSPRFFQVNRRL